MKGIATLFLISLSGSAIAAPCGPHQCPQAEQTICEGDTRGDRRCNHDPTHRVCAKIGDKDTSFFKFTGQRNWCNTSGQYGGKSGHLDRCPPNKPTWCICKWATAKWIAGTGCNEQVNIDCAATDICQTSQGLFFSYDDYQVDLKPAHKCVEQKCSDLWAACAKANPKHSSAKLSTQESTVLSNNL